MIATFSLPAETPFSIRRTLEALLGVAQSEAVGRRRERVALKADDHALLVHDLEHDRHALARLADQIALAPSVAAVIHGRRDRRVDPHLLLDPGAEDVVGDRGIALRVETELRHDEARNTLGPERIAYDPRQDDMHHLGNHVVLARGDEDLRSLDLVAIARDRSRLGQERAHVRAGAGLGQRHGPLPLAARSAWSPTSSSARRSRAAGACWRTRA